MKKPTKNKMGVGEMDAAGPKELEGYSWIA